jgi:hypothetical protein
MSGTVAHPTLSATWESANSSRWRVTVKFADAFGELFRGHCVLVVHPAEGLLVQVEAFFFSRLRSYQMTTGWQHALTLTQYSFGRLAEIGN